MSNRTDRLIKLLQLLRTSRHPKSARLLAQELCISMRSVYRDIDTLRHQGAVIDGEAGVGFVLQQDCNLPPLMFSENELEALMLGMRWAAAHADGEMAEAARSVLGKVHAVLPARLAEQAEAHAVYPINCATTFGHDEEHVLAQVRQALRQEQTLSFSTPMCKGRPADARCGRWRWAIGTTCGFWRLGAPCGRHSAISVATASRRFKPAQPIPCRTACCCNAGGSMKGWI